MMLLSESSCELLHWQSGIKSSWVLYVAKSLVQYGLCLEDVCIPMLISLIPRPSLRLQVADVALRAFECVFLHAYLRWVPSRL
jgi:hypothetical protein